MPSRSASVLALAFFAVKMVSALSVTTLSVPGVQPSDAPDLVWSPIGTGEDGRTTYVVHANQPSSSDGLGVFTATVALGASDAVVYESESGAGAVTESCAWGADSSGATCVLVGPSVSGSVTMTGTQTFKAAVGAVAVTLAADSPTSSSSASSGSNSPSGSDSAATAGGGAADTGAVTNGPAPTAAPSSGNRALASCTAVLGAAVISFIMVL